LIGHLIDMHIYSQTWVRSLSNPWSRTGVAENRQHPRWWILLEEYTFCYWFSAMVSADVACDQCTT